MPPPPMPANRPRHGTACRQHGLRQRRGQCRLARLPARIGVRRARGAGDGDEAGAEALQAGQIDVAAVGLIRRLRPSAVSTGSIAMQPDCVEQSPQFSQTSGLMTTRACRLGQLAALAAAALLGGADLIVDQHGDAVVVAQVALHRVEFVAGVAGDAGRQRGGGRQPVGLVGHHGDALHALGARSARRCRRR